MGEDSPFAGMTPIQQSISREMGPETRLATASPKAKPEQPKALAATIPAPAELPPMGEAPPTDPGTKKASTAPSPDAPDAPPLIDIPAGRPAPFAGTVPSTPRTQAAPEASNQPRPAPYAEQEPRQGRPRQAANPAVKPRPTAPVPVPAPGPITLLQPGPGPLPMPQPGPGPLPPASPDPGAPVLPPTASANSTAPPLGPTADFSVVPTSGGTRIARPKFDELSIVGRPAARVGDEVITIHQLRAAYKEKLELIPAAERSNPIVQKMVVERVLDNLIDRALVLQAAKKQLKDPKQLKAFYDSIEKVWLDHEVPPLLKVYQAANVGELKTKLEDKGKAYDELRQEFRDNTLAQEFLAMKMKEKLMVSLPEMYRYYDNHMKEYDRPAQILWREVVIDLAKYPNRVAARQRADALLARLRNGEDFATLAKKESQGPTASAGGKWETTPGSYGVPSVNDALNRLGVNQLSPIIEAPSSFHIVLVELRRPAGPARFDEVQDEVRMAVADGKRKKAAGTFINALRERTIVTTMFDEAKADDAAMKTSGTTPIPER